MFVFTKLVMSGEKFQDRMSCDLTFMLRKEKLKNFGEKYLFFFNYEPFWSSTHVFSIQINLSFHFCCILRILDSLKI